MPTKKRKPVKKQGEPGLTGDVATDRALWELAEILADIARNTTDSTQAVLDGNQQTSPKNGPK